MSDGLMPTADYDLMINYLNLHNINRKNLLSKLFSTKILIKLFSSCHITHVKVSKPQQFSKKNLIQSHVKFKRKFTFCM